MKATPEKSVTIPTCQYADLIREASAGRMLMNLLDDWSNDYHIPTIEEIHLLSHLLNGKPFRKE